MSDNQQAVQEELIKELHHQIGELKQECQSLSDENRARTKSETLLYNTLVIVRDAIAVDTVLERTHAQRNKALRSIARLIQRVIENDDFEGLSDDIPF